MLSEKRTLVVIGTSIVALLLLYYLGFSKTWALYSEAKFYEKNLQDLDKVETEYAQMLKDNNRYDSLLSNNPSEDNVQRMATYLGSVSSRNRLRMVSFERMDTLQNGFYLIETYKISLEGGYKDVLKTINEVESQSNDFAIVSLGFATEENRRTRNKMLVSSLYFRIIRKMKNEK